MAQNPDSVALSLVCAENKNSCLECSAIDELGCALLPLHHQGEPTTLDLPSFFDDNRREILMGFATESEDSIKEMIDREKEHLPRDDYLKRFRTGDLDCTVRTEALDWILKAQELCSFGPLSVCLSMNYLDRFLSVYDLPKGMPWTVQLLAVSCLSLAAKLEETTVPLLVDLQVAEPRFAFEAKTIQRMELLVLDTLKWRMQALTPCSFIAYFLRQITDEQQLSTISISRSVQLILSTLKGIDFLEFRPSEIAAAVAISMSKEAQAAGSIDKAMPCFIDVLIEKDRVSKCIELIKDLSVSSGATSVPPSFVPQSPDGVLDASCLSYKSDDKTAGSSANSSSCHNQRH
ncbi:hypothetical protein Tsubulata_007514 [Turnera subulata]|uniref:B-like cyclin n=1 Tax=Turnera subulata TaxID=218843 RepID=A0A9Q0FYF9_9ROSI|nr:hypothetical protein Tsubulata_007514 [Turnera subulata]